MTTQLSRVRTLYSLGLKRPVRALYKHARYWPSAYKRSLAFLLTTYALGIFSSLSICAYLGAIKPRDHVEHLDNGMVRLIDINPMGEDAAVEMPVRVFIGLTSAMGVGLFLFVALMLCYTCLVMQMRDKKAAIDTGLLAPHNYTLLCPILYYSLFPITLLGLIGAWMLHSFVWG